MKITIEQIKEYHETTGLIPPLLISNSSSYAVMWKLYKDSERINCPIYPHESVSEAIIKSHLMNVNQLDDALNTLENNNFNFSLITDSETLKEITRRQIEVDEIRKGVAI